jgi:hypothetical protein
MKIYKDLSSFWNEYFSQTPEYHFDDWSIVHFGHVSDSEYADIKGTKKDTLGFQPALITIANPHHQQSADVVIKGMSDSDMAQLKQLYQQRFIEQFESRFGAFYPEKKSGSVEYDSWDLFTAFWVEAEGKNVLKYNVPLLFDHPTDLEYWAWQQKKSCPIQYQRLIVTVFQPRKNQFHDIFIQNVKESDMPRIRAYMKEKISESTKELF